MADVTQKARRRKRGSEHEDARKRGEAEQQEEQGGDELRGTVEDVTEGARDRRHH